MSSNRASTSFLSGANERFVAELYQRFVEDPQSVDPSWRDFFASLGDDARAVLRDVEGASWSPRGTAIVTNGNGRAAPAAAPVARAGAAAASADEVQRAAYDSIHAFTLIRSYRVRGHLQAKLDPLGLEGLKYHPELDYRSHGVTDADLDRKIFINTLMGLGEWATLREIVERCHETYCGSVGVEYMHIQDTARRAWIQERIETIQNRTDFTLMGKKAILERLTVAEVFERFLDKKYTGTKRFGLDGGESLIPALEQIIKRGG
ncbi:MAG: 2-oxoglutarate dehydrogenase E1 subunit family protein, partial [Candidatus Eiseniibacteriota bacterium]